MDKTTVINLIGAPGSGKSTGAGYVFAHLKMNGINCELVQEYAKARVWQNDLEVFQNQLYVIGKQTLYQSRLKGKVEVIITDSPILMGAFYAKQLEYYEPFKQVLYSIHQEYNNLDYYVERVKPYNPKGRFQDEKGSDEVGVEILKLYESFNVKLNRITGERTGYDQIVLDYLQFRTKNRIGERYEN